VGNRYHAIDQYRPIAQIPPHSHLVHTFLHSDPDEAGNRAWQSTVILWQSRRSAPIRMASGYLDDDDDVPMGGEEVVPAASIVAAAVPAVVSSSSSSAAVAGDHDEDEGPAFAPLGEGAGPDAVVETRKIRVPPHRYTPLRENWESLMRPVVEHMKLQVRECLPHNNNNNNNNSDIVCHDVCMQIRFNPKARCVELRNSAYTTEAGALAKAEEFIHAFMCGFEVRDAVALLRLEDLRVGAWFWGSGTVLAGHATWLARRFVRCDGRQVAPR
jgi:hypothetical protein